MNDDYKALFSVWFNAAIISFYLIGYMAYENGIDEGIKRMKKEAIAHKFAGYNRDTGKFEWNHIKETN